MSTIADLTVYDGLATPVAHVLKAVEASRNGNASYAFWRENLSGVPIDAQVRYEAWINRTKAGTFVPRGRLTIPVQEVVTGSNSLGYSAAPKVAHNATIEFVAYFSPRSTEQNRVDCGTMLSNIMRGNSGSFVPQVGGGFGGQLLHWLINAA